ncbi:MAG: hypothetical protein QXF41_01980 [Candidatus Micrarchaeaceae archaeon]
MELNEASLIEREIVIRKMQLPKDVLETRRSIARWLALALGIINPGESRLSAVAVLDALVDFQFVRGTDPTVKDIMGYIEKNWEAMNEKTLRYHLLRMKNMGIIENKEGKFYFKPPAVGNRYDAAVWADQLFRSELEDVSKKISEAVKEIKNKSV